METKTEPTTATPTSTIVKKQPNVDTRFKTEDVTDRKGLEFKDFKLCEELNLVSAKINLNKISPRLRAFTKWVSSSRLPSKKKLFLRLWTEETFLQRPKMVQARQLPTQSR